MSNCKKVFSVTREQLNFFTEYTRCGLAHNGRDLNKLWDMVEKIEKTDLDDVLESADSDKVAHWLKEQGYKVEL